MTTNYKRGQKTEERACQELERVGYYASRSAGSHGIWDVVAVGPTGIRLIQCKRTKQYYQSDYEQAKEQLKGLPVLPGVSREIWVWRDNEGWVIQEVV